MDISRRKFAAGALAGLAASQARRLQARRPPPKLFVFLIAEQFRQIYLDRANSLLAPGGFRGLSRADEEFESPEGEYNPLKAK